MTPRIDCKYDQKEIFCRKQGTKKKLTEHTFIIHAVVSRALYCDDVSCIIIIIIYFIIIIIFTVMVGQPSWRGGSVLMNSLRTPVGVIDGLECDQPPSSVYNECTAQQYFEYYYIIVGNGCMPFVIFYIQTDNITRYYYTSIVNNL